MNELRTAVDAMLGEVSRLVSCDGDLDVAVIPIPADPEVGEEGGLFVVTIGLSKIESAGEIPRAEVLLLVSGARSETETDAIARELAKVAQSIPELRVDVVFPFAWAHAFTRMDAAVITEYIDGPEYLFRVEPPVRLLAVRPIFASEGRWIEKLGSEAARAQIAAGGWTWFDPERPAADPPLTLIKENEVVMSKTVDVRALWAELEKWLEGHNAAATVRNLETAASASAVAAIEGVPADLAASLETHDGTGTIDSYELLSAKAIANAASDPPDGWDASWLVFGKDSAGNRLCLDLGNGGRVIKWDRNTKETSPTPYASYGAWLTALRDDAVAGKLEVDEDGFVNRT